MKDTDFFKWILKIKKEEWIFWSLEISIFHKIKWTILFLFKNTNLICRRFIIWQRDRIRVWWWWLSLFIFFNFYGNISYYFFLLTFSGQVQWLLIQLGPIPNLLWILYLKKLVDLNGIVGYNETNNIGRRDYSHQFFFELV